MTVAWIWLLSVAAWAQPAPLVLVGDGLVAGATTEAAAGARGQASGGWASVLADCLEERAPGRWAVVDRTVEAETARSAHAQVEAVRGLKPELVVVGVGAREAARADASPEGFRTELSGLVGALEEAGAKRVLLLGVLPSGAAASADDARLQAWNAAIAQVASSRSASRAYVDIWTDWPKAGEARAKLVDPNASLSHQGHARVAAAVCDAAVGK